MPKPNIRRNPILKDDEAVARFSELPAESKTALHDFLKWLYPYAREKAEFTWRHYKPAEAVYWKTVASWASHLAVAINRKG